MSEILNKLAQMGETLPAPLKPVGSYVPALQVGNLVYTSGQLPMKDGQLVCKGSVDGTFINEQQAADAAKICTLNGLSAIKDVIGDLDRITQVVKVTGFVNSAQKFSNQPAVINGASDFLKELFGDKIGSHARSAVGVSELPLDASVEIEFIVQVD